MTQAKKKDRSIWIAFAVIGALLAVIAMPFVIAFSPMGDAINEAQVSVFGGYYPKLTMMLSIVLTIGVAVGIGKLWGLVSRIRKR